MSTPRLGGRATDLLDLVSVAGVSAALQDVLPVTSTLAGWWKANALTLLDGDPVGSWTESSGLNRHATQATAANKPMFKTNIKNGLPVVRFDGVDDRVATALFGDIAQPITAFVVLARGSAVPADAIVFSGIASLKRNQFQLRPSTNAYALFAGSSMSGGLLPAAGIFFVASILFSGASSQLWRNDVSEIGPAAAGTQVLDGLTVGNTDPAVANVPFQGDIAEIVLYSSALSAADRTSVVNFLRTKYAI